jgi:hypothetical protein
MPSKEQKRLFALVKKKGTQIDELRQIINEHNIPIDVRNQLGETLIENSCKNTDNFVIVNWLYENGCGNIEDLNNAFHNLLFMCPKKNIKQMYDWFLEHGAKINIPSNTKHYKSVDLPFEQIGIHRLIGKIWFNTTKYHTFYFHYLNTYYDITEKDKYGNTYLHYLAYFGYVRNTTNPLKKEYLFQKKVDINAQNIEGNTALHIRCVDLYLNSNSLSVIGFPQNSETLLIKNNKGETPLDMVHTQFREYLKNKPYSEVMCMDPHDRNNYSQIQTWYNTLKYLGDDFQTDEFLIKKMHSLAKW